MEAPDTIFSIPTYRLRDVPDTIERYDENFWRNGHEVALFIFDDSSLANHHKYYSQLGKPELPIVFIMLDHGRRSALFNSSCVVCASQSWKRWSAISFARAMAETGTSRSCIRWVPSSSPPMTTCARPR